MGARDQRPRQVPGWSVDEYADARSGRGRAPALFHRYVRRRPRTAQAANTTNRPAGGGAAGSAPPISTPENRGILTASLAESGVNSEGHTTNLERFRCSEGGVISPYGAPVCGHRDDGGSSWAPPAAEAGAGDVVDVVSLGASGGTEGAVGAVVVPFAELASVAAMGTGRQAAVIGFDTEFVTRGGRRRVLSYQATLVDPRRSSELVDVVLVPVAGGRLTLLGLLVAVDEVVGLWAHPMAGDLQSPRGVPRLEVLDDDGDVDCSALARQRVPVVLAGHYLPADLTALDPRVHRLGPDLVHRPVGLDGRRRVEDLPRLMTSAAGGLVSLRPVRVQAVADGHSRYYRSYSVVVRDTMAHAPAGSQSLAALGEAAGVGKLDLDDWITRMDELWDHDPGRFLEYASRDAEIVVEYQGALWGDGVVPPITLSGGAASAMVSSGVEYFGGEGSADFRRDFAGVEKVKDGVDVEEGLDFFTARSLRPVDGAAGIVSLAAAEAYHGGLNSCPVVGIVRSRTVDVDARNAYPTAMSAVPDPAWDEGVIAETIHERPLTLDDVPTPTTLAFAFVSFEFPEDVLYPCLPVRADGTLIYPRTSEGIAGAWCAGPELHLALRLGARVVCQIGYRCRVRMRDGEPSMSLRHGVRQLIRDRAQAKASFGAGSLEEKALKTAVNSIYGKTAQDISGQRAWDAWAGEMDVVGASSITSPVHAAMTTTIVRAQMLAAMNQLHERGFQVYSVTTDGFITDAPVDVVEGLALHGLAEPLRDARRALVGEDTLWEAKHSQETLLSFTTRGNVSLAPGGVCAHNGFKVPAGIEPDSEEDRRLLHDVVVSRDGRVENPYVRFPSWQELSREEDRKDFLPTEVDRSISMDYDLKREPDFGTMTAETAVDEDGHAHEVATFCTRPWETVGDAVRAREIARGIARESCLRTVDQWRGWHLRYAHGAGRRIVTADRAILMSIVRAHRTGVVEIPTLADRSIRVADKLAWLEAWGLGTVTRDDWKNAGRRARASAMLPLEELEPWLGRMIATPAGEPPAGASGAGDDPVTPETD